MAEMGDVNETVDVDEKVRPNIRIQIHNNLMENEKMEVDNEENEDGEIVEPEEESVTNTNPQTVLSSNLGDKVCKNYTFKRL